MKRTSRAVNVLNVSETETYWIYLVVMGLFVIKVSLKCNINMKFFIRLFLSLLRLYWSEKRFSHHSKLKLCTKREFFFIESIKISDDLKNESQYLYLQLIPMFTAKLP